MSALCFHAYVPEVACLPADLILALLLHSVLAAVDERIHTHPEVRPAKELTVIEDRVQQRITIEKRIWQQQQDVVQPRPAMREVEDDWFILLDMPPKKSGRIQRNFVRKCIQASLAEVSNSRLCCLY